MAGIVWCQPSFKFDQVWSLVLQAATAKTAWGTNTASAGGARRDGGATVWVHADAPTRLLRYCNLHCITSHRIHGSCLVSCLGRSAVRHKPRTDPASRTRHWIKVMDAGGCHGDSPSFHSLRLQLLSTRKPIHRPICPSPSGRPSWTLTKSPQQQRLGMDKSKAAQGRSR